MFRAVLLGALLTAAPLFSERLPGRDPRVEKGQVIWFLLTESREQVAKAMGPPSVVSEIGQYVSWQYMGGDVDHHEPSHTLIFRKADGVLAGVTRNYEPDRDVDALFPAKETSAHHFPNAEKPEMSLRLRRLPGGRVLIAIGSPKPGTPTPQLTLMREAELKIFYPWLSVPR
ncbi:MAG: hypothetical protein SFV54_12430 [Bryobacteraceae bacterium]|nr:hypothetical protein [Bryobacteraceae bacterium]